MASKFSQFRSPAPFKRGRRTEFSRQRMGWALTQQAPNRQEGRYPLTFTRETERGYQRPVYPIYHHPGGYSPLGNNCILCKSFKYPEKHLRRKKNILLLHTHAGNDSHCRVILWRMCSVLNSFSLIHLTASPSALLPPGWGTDSFL